MDQHFLVWDLDFEQLNKYYQNIKNINFYLDLIFQMLLLTFL
jgi:hypothetical protein